MSEQQQQDEMPALDMDIITITRTKNSEGWELDVNHDGLDEDLAVAILMRAVSYLTATECSCEYEEDEEDDEE